VLKYSSGCIAFFTSGGIVTQSLFTQNVIAIIWDFDKTLTSAYMQAPLFKHFAVDERRFWTEANRLEKFYRDRGAHNVSRDSLYLNHILTYVREGIFKDLTNDLLMTLGAEIEFYPGLPDFFEKLRSDVEDNPEFSKHGVTLEHYIVSTGLRKMIEGSRIAPYVRGIWGCEFVEGTAKPGYLDQGQAELFSAPSPGHITDIAYAIDNTTKTRALFEISKGANKHPEIDVNATLAPEDRRVPFQNMIYIADGPSDVPAFSILNQYGGQTFAVYKPGMRDQFVQVNRLLREKRVHGIGEANYVDKSLTAFWITTAVTDVASRIVEARQTALRERVGSSPQHILTDLAEKAAAPVALPSLRKPPLPDPTLPLPLEMKPTAPQS
jgi:hypothetical protein